MSTSIQSAPSARICRRRMRANRVTVVVGLLSLIGAPAFAEGPVERFIASLESSETATPDIARMVKESWASCADCDPAEFLTQGLAVLSEPFREVLDEYDADRYEACAARAAALRDAPDHFIATNAAYYEVKSLVELENLKAARERIDDLYLDGGDALHRYSYGAAEISFLHGYCLLGDLQYGAAAVALERFLKNHPEAPERLRMSAQQMQAELAIRKEGQIGEVVDLMGFSRRRLADGASGKNVQTRQDRIVELLDGMIEEAEQQEQSSSSASGSDSNSEQRQQQQESSRPMQRSGLPGGQPGGEDGSRAARRANPADAWGAMPPAERQRILQALRDSFPKRYRRLVEQYYEDLAKKR